MFVYSKEDGFIHEISGIEIVESKVSSWYFIEAFLVHPTDPGVRKITIGEYSEKKYAEKALDNYAGIISSENKLIKVKSEQEIKQIYFTDEL